MMNLDKTIETINSFKNGECKKWDENNDLFSKY